MYEKQTEIDFVPIIFQCLCRFETYLCPENAGETNSISHPERA